MRCAALISLLALGCNPVTEVIDQHRAAAESRLERLAEIREMARSAGPQNDRTIGIGELGDRDKLRFEVWGGPGDWTAAVVNLESLDDLTTEGAPPLLVNTTPFWWWGSACLLRDGKWTNGETLTREATAEGVFVDLQRVEYLVVVRTVEYAAPSLDRAAASGEPSEFAAGRFEGDGLLFAIEDAALIGGFRIVATNSSQGRTRRVGAQADDLVTDLKVSVDDVIRDALRDISVGGATLGGT